ncbi:MAG: sulfite exporter TauE/SafE family protein [Chloroflexi bacterium]|nr:sulfite exporter TauE/SafE family protein [Chloroflexota bacterium]
MCSGVSILFARRGIATTRTQFAILHLGRIITYAILGLTAGAITHTANAMMHHDDHASPALNNWQGALALVGALVAFYFALALLGRVPSPEIIFVNVTRGWGQMIQRLPARVPAAPFVFGLAWGLLPCALVLTALVMSASAGSPLASAATMLAFGLGTLPALVGVSLIAQTRALALPRHIAAFVIFLFGAQMALRGFAAWGIIAHAHFGGLALW